MNIHEYQGKEIFKKYGVPVPRGSVAFTPDEVFKIASELGGVVVVKSQIHAGGRGKGKIYSANKIDKKLITEGGVKVVKNADSAREAAKEILGNILVTHQTGSQGKTVKKVLVEEGLKIAKEYYLGLVIDRSTSRVTLMASSEGGMEIEKVADENPNKIFKAVVDPALGLTDDQGTEIGISLGLDRNFIAPFVGFCRALYRFFVDGDCSLVEINPLVLTEAGGFLAADAKINFDDNALFKHHEYEPLRDLNEENPNETIAKKHDLSYISLDGSIGCMVNGAGLAMATMDIIKLHGGEPANFLDVGGGANEEKVKAAFKIILSDPQVKAILINIFGGIMKCDIIALGVVSAAKDVQLKVPLVVRLLGTNVAEGRKILAESGLPIISAETMSEAAQKVVASL